jgi:arginine/ornithine N-succinyltransferase beta subunit
MLQFGECNCKIWCRLSYFTECECVRNREESKFVLVHRPTSTYTLTGIKCIMVSAGCHNQWGSYEGLTMAQRNK